MVGSVIVGSVIGVSTEGGGVSVLVAGGRGVSVAGGCIVFVGGGLVGDPGIKSAVLVARTICPPLVLVGDKGGEACVAY